MKKTSTLSCHLFAFSLLAAGCAPIGSLTDVEQPELIVRNDTFNESVVIESTPQAWCFNPNQDSGLLAYFGYEWNTEYPDDVIIQLRTDDISSFLDFDVKIDGKIYNYEPGRTYTRIGGYKEYQGWDESSTARVAVPLKVLREMTTADKVLLRVNQSDGYGDCNYSIVEKTWDEHNLTIKFTKHYAIEFLQAVDNMKAEKAK